jgi:predicted DNA binding CopG/RHH family protein
MNRKKPKKQEISKFKKKTAEASWWDAHKPQVESDLLQAMRNGSTLHLKDILAPAKRKTALQSVTIRLMSEDLQAARQFAQDKGVGYQTYIRLLLHEALRTETLRPSAPARTTQNRKQT